MMWPITLKLCNTVLTTRLPTVHGDSSRMLNREQNAVAFHDAEVRFVRLSARGRRNYLRSMIGRPRRKYFLPGV